MITNSDIPMDYAGMLVTSIDVEQNESDVNIIVIDFITQDGKQANLIIAGKSMGVAGVGPLNSFPS